MKLIFKEPLFNDINNAAECFEHCMALRGEIFKASPARVVYRFLKDGRAYFIKVHEGVGWREIFKNLLQLKWPVLGASHEWRALQRLHELNVMTLNPIAFGVSGFNPATRRSFLITDELTDAVSLEKITLHWRLEKPPFVLKQALLHKLASVVGAMHAGGVNHRDCYLCHFLLHIPEGVGDINPNHLMLYVVDLHRAQVRKRVPARWLIKDLAALYFSAMDIGLTRRDVLRFIKIYRKNNLRNILARETFFWWRVEKKAKTLCRKHNK